MGAPSQLQIGLVSALSGAGNEYLRQQQAEQAKQDKLAQLNAMKEMRLEELRARGMNPEIAAKIKRLEGDVALKNAMADWYRRRPASTGRGGASNTQKQALDAQKQARLVAAQVAGLVKGESVTSLSPEAAAAYENTYHQFMSGAVPGYQAKRIFDVGESSWIPGQGRPVTVLDWTAVNEPAETTTPALVPTPTAGGKKKGKVLSVK